MMFTGRAVRVGDDIDTDVIIPGRYLAITDMSQLAEHVFEGLGPEWPTKIKAGDIIVAGRNFGCGSSREHAPLALKGAGVSGVIASSFARIFFRNAINLGLPIIICPEVTLAVRDGDMTEVDTDKGIVQTPQGTYRIEPYPAFLQELIAAGGLVEWARQEVRRRKTE
ncbi:MAG: 3-isopropylmalate dehydratase small subunit [Firmicutes bacterium]|jgi:3-isopropylmalate/(R)-2-methylmalate dehydratase small subunit|uniref:3-isopropylmalate dehydratase small subunit n=1 Tax=Sulfobacillus benefaciens TaxID=453960 RepID=A0A2T2WYX3_9FIRM|nr:3-isopropylmalate dehydratase small subunit [Bacillota bacterium]PSR27435.1 MAG: 3-isopropylmalate dehydratase [Sulfobacillus benefaciens]